MFPRKSLTAFYKSYWPSKTHYFSSRFFIGVVRNTRNDSSRFLILKAPEDAIIKPSQSSNKNLSISEWQARFPKLPADPKVPPPVVAMPPSQRKITEITPPPPKLSPEEKAQQIKEQLQIKENADWAAAESVRRARGVSLPGPVGAPGRSENVQMTPEAEEMFFWLVSIRYDLSFLEAAHIFYRICLLGFISSSKETFVIKHEEKDFVFKKKELLDLLEQALGAPTTLRRLARYVADDISIFGLRNYLPGAWAVRFERRFNLFYLNSTPYEKSKMADFFLKSQNCKDKTPFVFAGLVVLNFETNETAMKVWYAKECALALRTYKSKPLSFDFQKAYNLRMSQINMVHLINFSCVEDPTKPFSTTFPLEFFIPIICGIELKNLDKNIHCPFKPSKGVEHRYDFRQRLHHTWSFRSKEFLWPYNPLRMGVFDPKNLFRRPDVKSFSANEVQKRLVDFNLSKEHLIDGIFKHFPADLQNGFKLRGTWVIEEKIKKTE